MQALRPARLAVVAVAATLLVVAAPARAGTVATTIEAPTVPALSLAVSQAAVEDGDAGAVVVVPDGRPALLAVGAAFAGTLPDRAPVLVSGPGANARAVAAEADRATGGGDDRDPPVAWLLGADDPGLGDGWDVHRLDGTDAEIAGALLRSDVPAGTGDRVLVFAEDDGPAAAVSAAFGGAYGLPAVPLPADGSVPPALDAALPPPGRLHTIAVGGVPADPARFGDVTAVDAGSPAALSVAVADQLVGPERGAGFEYPVTVRPVTADGYGADPSPAILAAVVAASIQDDAGKPPLYLVDGRPPADPAAACRAGAVDASSVCAIAAAAGDTTLVTLTGTDRGQAPAAVPPPPPAAGGTGGGTTRTGGTLPATGPAMTPVSGDGGGPSTPAVGAAALALALAAGALGRRVMTRRAPKGGRP